MEQRQVDPKSLTSDTRRTHVVIIESDPHLRAAIARKFREVSGQTDISELQSLNEFKPSQLNRAANLVILDPEQLDQLEQNVPVVLDNPAFGVVLFTDQPVGTLGILFCRAAVIGAVPKSSGVAALQRFTKRSCFPVLHDRVDGEAEIGKTLSRRERETLSLVGMGLAHKEAAERMKISAKTVETYKARACQKLGITNRSQIIALVNRLQDPAGHTLNPIQIPQKGKHEPTCAFSSRRHRRLARDLTAPLSAVDSSQQKH